MESRDSSTAQQKTYQIQFQLQNSQTKIYDNIFTDAMFQYITAASSLTNSSLTSFFVNNTNTSQDGSSFVESTKKNLFFVRENGLFVLRKGSEDIALDFYNFYYNLTNDFEGTFKLIMILAIIVLFLSQFVLIPIVFSVHKTNTRVLSLFGIIPIAEIKELAVKCERFTQNFLEDQVEKKEGEDAQNQEGGTANQQGRPVGGGQNPGEEGSKGQAGPNPNNQTNLEINNEDVQPEGGLQADQIKVNVDNNTNSLNVPGKGSQIAKNLITPQSQQLKGNQALNNSKLQQSQQVQQSQVFSKTTPNNQLPQSQIKGPGTAGGPNGTTAQGNNNAHNQSTNKNPNAPGATAQGNTKDKPEDGDKNQDGDDQEYERSKKLMNSKDNNKKIVIFQFSFIAALFITYFVVNFVLELQFLDYVRLTYNHLQLVAMRPSFVKYVVMFTLEELGQGKVQYENNDINRDMKEIFTNLIYENERDIFTSYKETYPSEFSDYLDLFKLINYDDICTYSDEGNKNKEDCKSVSKGILEKGLRTSIVSLAENTRDLISKFRTSAKELADKIASINSESYKTVESMIKYIIPSVRQLNQILLNDIQTYLNGQQSIEEIKFSIFIVAIFLVFILIWTPYLQSLNNKIWRTKGMLNMIPMDIITKHEKLKQAFVSGDILQAVK